MARGPKRHLKRLNAPKHWMLDKLGGVWAPRPSTGPHKLRECLPLIILLRNRLKYALNTKEVKYILMQRLVKIDGKARTDKTYPAGFMDVVGIEKTNENFRLLYDIRGRFAIHRIGAEEAKVRIRDAHTHTRTHARRQPLAACSGSRAPQCTRESTLRRRGARRWQRGPVVWTRRP